MSNKAIFKILIAVAWIDGEIQPEEQRHLQQLAERQGLDQDDELRGYLDRPVSSADCYRWIGDYLGTQATEDRTQALLEAVSGLIYSDGDVATREAQLLQSLQPAMAASQPEPIGPKDVALARIRSLYQKWLTTIG
jgi:uncharacterized tellurite resistance protein B-like protein